jgi:uncharacterized SAM-binding protein YcdF (DUF218 family)
MFLLASKLIPQLIYPIGMVFFLLVFAIFIKGRPRIQSGVLWVTLGVFVIASNGLVAKALIRSLENQYEPLGEGVSADLIVVLAGGEEPLNPPRSIPEINGAGDRYIYALQLYQQQTAPRVLVSGGGISWMDNEGSRAVQIASLLALIGLPEEDLIIEGRSRNTYENARESNKLVQEHGYSQIVLVTSAYHMPRAVGVFEEQGLSVIPAPVDYQVTEQDRFINPDQSWQNRFLDLFPSLEAMGLTTRAMREYIGIWIYTIRGWM